MSTGRRCRGSSTAPPTRWTATARSCARHLGATVRRRPHPRRRQRQHRRHHQEPADLRHGAEGQQRPDRAVPESAGHADQRARRQPVRSGRRVDQPVGGDRRGQAVRRGHAATRPANRSSGWPTSPRTWSTARCRLENVLHIAPNAFANGYNIYSPDTGDYAGAFALPNFSNPIQFVCGAIGAIENTTAPGDGEAVRAVPRPRAAAAELQLLLPFRGQPVPDAVGRPADVVVTDPALAPNGGGTVRPPEPLPAVSAYVGSGDIPPPPGLGSAARTVDWSGSPPKACRHHRRRRCCATHRRSPRRRLSRLRAWGRRPRPCRRPLPRRRPCRACCCRPKDRHRPRRPTRRCLPKGHRDHDREADRTTGRTRVRRGAHRERMRVPGPEFAAAAGCGGARVGREHLSRRDRECRLRWNRIHPS